MRPRFRHLIAFLILAAALSCESEEDKVLKIPLLPAETFNWCIVPISFQPPPAEWARQKHNSGGLLGVWFTHSHSVGERIYISEYYKVGRRAVREEPYWPYSIDDVVEETSFSTEGWPVHPDSFIVSEMQSDSIAGIPAYRLDFIFNLPDRGGLQLVGREYYFVKDNHLFEAAYMGLPVNLPLFERIVETITFPSVGGP